MSITKKINYVSRTFYISALSLLFTIITPYIACAGETPYTQAQMISQISYNNPYQALVYILSLITGLSILAMAYLYNQQSNNLKEQFVILKNVSDNMGVLSNKIQNSHEILEKNQEILEKGLDTVHTKLSDKPCLLNSDLMRDILANVKK